MVVFVLQRVPTSRRPPFNMKVNALGMLSAGEVDVKEKVTNED
jgi:hypothetical protein